MRIETYVLVIFADKWKMKPIVTKIRIIFLKNQFPHPTTVGIQHPKVCFIQYSIDCLRAVRPV